MCSGMRCVLLDGPAIGAGIERTCFSSWMSEDSCAQNSKDREDRDMHFAFSGFILGGCGVILQSRSLLKVSIGAPGPATILITSPPQPNANLFLGERTH